MNLHDAFPVSMFSEVSLMSAAGNQCLVIWRLLTEQKESRDVISIYQGDANIQSGVTLETNTENAVVHPLHKFPS